MSDVIKIQEYNLFDYSLKLQEAVESGYRVGDGVDGCPMIVGFSYCATLTKQDTPKTFVGELALKVSVDTTVLQEQLKQGGEIEQAIEESLVIEDVVAETPVDTIEPQVPVESPKPPTKRTKRG